MSPTTSLSSLSPDRTVTCLLQIPKNIPTDLPLDGPQKLTWIAWLPECLVTAARPGRRLRAAVCVACLVQAGAGLCAAPLPCLAARFVCCTAASGLRTPDATPRPRQPAALRHRRRPVTRVLLGLGLGLGSQEMPMLAATGLGGQRP